MNTPETFDRNWVGPEHLKPRVYRRQIEKDIWYGCVVEDEYRCPTFAASDVVVDIGAHIGAFSWLAQNRGSRRVYGFEANPWHYEAGVENLRGLEGVDYRFCAVVRSDDRRADEYRITPGEWNVWQNVGDEVASISLDEILEAVGPVRFLKIDCEGSEWPILYTCSRLSQVKEMVGEYHTRRFGELEFPELSGLPPCEPEALAGYLSDLGFTVEHSTENDGGTGHFRAWR